MLDHLLNTFMHSVAWHTGANFTRMIGLPLVGVFVIYGIYRYVKRR